MEINDANKSLMDTYTRTHYRAEVGDNKQRKSGGSERRIIQMSREKQEWETIKSLRDGESKLRP